MTLILEEDGEMAYCANCGKSALIPPGEELPENWIVYFDIINLPFCSEHCKEEYLVGDPDIDSFLDDFANGRIVFE